jgi:ABC-type amino acid transport substrate-binding protein
MVLREMGREPKRRFLDYYLILQLVEEGRIDLAYPFFKTKERDDKNILWSAKVVSVENRIYYSAKNNPQLLQSDRDIDGLIYGRVVGYSYGNTIDKKIPKVCEGEKENDGEDKNEEPSCREKAQQSPCSCKYNSAAVAMNALLKNDIDLLPMTARVANELVEGEFPHRLHEIKALSNPRIKEDLYVIFANTDAGRKLRKDFNQGLKQVNTKGLLRDLERTYFLNRHQSSGYVRLVVTEGFPVVIGFSLCQPPGEVCAEGEPDCYEKCMQTSPDCRGIERMLEVGEKSSPLKYHMIPQGSRAFVREWSPKALEPGQLQDLYTRMTELTVVEVVDGPRAGERFCVRNMHIAVE